MTDVLQNDKVESRKDLGLILAEFMKEQEVADIFDVSQQAVNDWKK
ncbi:MAG: hypothetical protein ABEJ56_04410 [Candidatus Nanohaloarchaea archaeon]